MLSLNPDAERMSGNPGRYVPVGGLCVDLRLSDCADGTEQESATTVGMSIELPSFKITHRGEEQGTVCDDPRHWSPVSVSAVCGRTPAAEEYISHPKAYRETQALRRR